MEGILAIVIAVAAVVGVYFLFLMMLKFMKKEDATFAVIQGTVKAIDGFMKLIDKDPTTENLQEKIVRIAQLAVYAVEQEYRGIKDEIDDAKRHKRKKAAALKIVKQILEGEGKVFDSVTEMIADKAIEMVVFFLNKSKPAESNTGEGGAEGIVSRVQLEESADGVVQPVGKKDRK